MNELLGNPAVQSAAAPFIVALVLALALSRTRFLAVAQVAGFLTLAALAIGLSFESLTSTKKLVLIGLGTGIAAFALEWTGTRTRTKVLVAVSVLAAACIWMLWRLLAQKEMQPALLAGVLSALYVAALAGSTMAVSDDPVRGAATGVMVGLGIGGLAVLGASAVLGLAGISVGAAAGATLLVQMIRGNAPAGWTISLPASAIGGLAAVLAVASASLAWYTLLPVLAAPWATRLVPATIGSVWLRAFLSALAALVPVLAAIGLAWFAPASG